MKTYKTCRNCIWCDLCGEDNICDDFTPLNESYIEDEYKSDLHMRVMAYQEHIDEMSGNEENLQNQIGE